MLACTFYDRFLVAIKEGIIINICNDIRCLCIFRYVVPTAGVGKGLAIDHMHFIRPKCLNCVLRYSHFTFTPPYWK